MKILFIASKFEADFFTEGLQKVNNHYFEGDYHVLITGIGLVNMAISCTDFFTAFSPEPDDELINIGIAGSVSPKIEIGSIFNPKCFSVYSSAQVPHSSQKIYEQAYPVIDRGDVHLASSITPVWGSEHVHKLKTENVSLLDMEAYSFASVCTKQNVPFQVYKAVSDHLIKRSQSEFVDNASEALLKLKKMVLES